MSPKNVIIVCQHTKKCSYSLQPTTPQQSPQLQHSLRTSGGGGPLGYSRQARMTNFGKF